MRLAALVLAFGTIVTLMPSKVVADNSCNLARNARCEEPYLGTGTCRPGTDTTDCANSYVLPGSDRRKLTTADLTGMSRPHLRLARNEIFARHGYRFKSTDLKAFFGARRWYKPGGAFSPSKIESANLALIKKIEGQTASGGSTVAAPPGAVPSYLATVKWADGRTGRVHHDGGREYWFEKGENRKRIIVPAKDEVYTFKQGGKTGIVTNIDLFPPVSVPALLKKYKIVPQPVGSDTLAGETTTKTRVDWSNDAHTLKGYVWFTADGIPIKVEVGGTFTECCGGDAGIKWSESYELRELERGKPDPAWFHLPEEIKWSYPG